MSFDFDELFVFEMANNHQGELSHGLRIVEEMGRIAKRHGLRAAVKLQYRELDTFIHPEWLARKDVKHIPRFLQTRLGRDQFGVLLSAIRENGMLTMVTPFDEPSVQLALEQGVDILKIASCSAMDWPLLEEVARARRPTICSTGGMSIQDIDKTVSFLEHRSTRNLALMHCVALYPTENERQNIAFIRKLRDRYPEFVIGYSGHESPDNTDVVKVAVSVGARILERHVGVQANGIALNGYSMSPEQTEKWIAAALLAKEVLGREDGEKQTSEKETQSLRELMRGVYCSAPIRCGERIERARVFFAMPCAEGQTTTREYLPGLIASRDYRPNEPISERRNYDPVQTVRSVVHDAKGLLREARIPIGSDYTVELSHHYGMDSFRRVGAIIVNLFNREYCKKLIILLPGQQHPNHTHRVKEETFQVLHGELELQLDGNKRVMNPGDVQLVKRNQWHSFSTQSGCVFEEISTTHIVGDSQYEDAKIMNLDPIQRKTIIESW